MSSSSHSKQYVVRFEGNSSKKYDNKEMWISAKLLDELYEPSTPAWQTCYHAMEREGGKIQHWNAVFIDPTVKLLERIKYGF